MGDRSEPDSRPVYSWRDHSRYVDVVPVQTGWLVVWGKYEDAGARKEIYGNQVYRDASGVRRRLVTAIVELTANPANAQDALALLDRQGGLPTRDLPELAEPL